MSVYLKNRKSKQMLQLFDEETETPKEIIETNIKEKSLKSGGSYKKEEIKKVENKPFEKLRVPKFSKKKTDVHKNNIVLILN